MSDYKRMDSSTLFAAELTIPGAPPRPVALILPRHQQIPAAELAEFFPSLGRGPFGWLFILELGNERRQTLVTADLPWYAGLQEAAGKPDLVDRIELPLERFGWRCGGWPGAENPSFGKSLAEIPHDER